MTNKLSINILGIVGLLVSAALPAQTLSQAADQQFITIGIHGYQGGADGCDRILRSDDSV